MSIEATSFENDKISPTPPERVFVDEVLSIEDLNIPPYDPEESFASRRQIVYDYLKNLEDGEREIAESIANDLLETGKSLANMVVIIPVAAHQEAAQIATAIAQYAKQETEEPFSVVLGLNYPLNKVNNPNISATAQAVEKAKHDYPSLDLRITATIYDEPVIGKIRRDLWNGVAMAAARGGNYEENIEVVGINHDIDLVRLSKNFIAIIQERYKKLDQRHIIADVLPIFGTEIKHAKSPQHPNISSAVFWSDYIIRKSGHTFEAGLVIPFSRYAFSEGFDPSSRTHETQAIMHRKPHLLPGTKTETSPRRYIARMQQDGYDIWSPETFSAEDECRETLDFPDLTKERYQEIVTTSMQGNIKLLLSGTIADAIRSFKFEKGNNTEALKKHIDESIERTAKVTNYILRNIVGLGELSHTATDMLLSQTLRDFYTKRHFGGL